MKASNKIVIEHPNTKRLREILEKRKPAAKKKEITLPSSHKKVKKDKNDKQK